MVKGANDLPQGANSPLSQFVVVCQPRARAGDRGKRRGLLSGEHCPLHKGHELAKALFESLSKGGGNDPVLVAIVKVERER